MIEDRHILSNAFAILLSLPQLRFILERGMLMEKHDSVIGKSSGYEITEEFLIAMEDYFFGLRRRRLYC